MLDIGFGISHLGRLHRYELTKPELHGDGQRVLGAITARV
jgi:hypothetical protein